MWVEQTGLAQLDTKLRYGATDEVDRLLRDVLSSPAVPGAVPVTCPTCRRDLVRQPLAIAGLFGSACPEGHGAWLSPDVADSLRALVGSKASAARRHPVVLACVLAGLSLIFLTILSLPAGLSTLPSVLRDTQPVPEPEAPGAEQADPARTPPGVATDTGSAAAPTTIDRIDNARLAADYWPERRWPGAGAIPLKESRIDVYEELLYFDQLLTLLETGISNRLNMEGVLSVSRSPEGYTALYDVYRQRQEGVLDQLRTLTVPARLQPVHEPIVRATERQIAFYGDFARAKIQDPTTTLRSLLGHPAVREQNQLLLSAWGRVTQTYPGLDKPTHDAIYYHLCGFDTI